jgi:hypothetical protein
LQGRSSEGLGRPAGEGFARERARATARGNLPGGPSGAGGAREPSRISTMRGGPNAPQGATGRPPADGKRGPNHQGKRPDQE